MVTYSAVAATITLVVAVLARAVHLGEDVALSGVVEAGAVGHALSAEVVVLADLAVVGALHSNMCMFKSRIYVHVGGGGWEGAHGSVAGVAL